MRITPHSTMSINERISKQFSERAILRIADHPDSANEAARWFSDKWGIPAEAYMESMAESIASEGDAVPQWFIVREGSEPAGPIIAGCGVIDNDFHDRPDLAPNLCALYVEESYRRQGIARSLLEHTRVEVGALGFESLYLVTEHTEFYERCGWEYLFDVNESEGGTIRMYKCSTARCVSGDVHF